MMVIRNGRMVVHSAVGMTFAAMDQRVLVVVITGTMIVRGLVGITTDPNLIGPPTVIVLALTGMIGLAGQETEVRRTEMREPPTALSAPQDHVRMVRRVNRVLIAIKTTALNSIAQPMGIAPASAATMIGQNSIVQPTVIVPALTAITTVRNLTVLLMATVHGLAAIMTVQNLTARRIMIAPVSTGTTGLTDPPALAPATIRPVPTSQPETHALIVMSGRIPAAGIPIRPVLLKIRVAVLPALMGIVHRVK
ncbi:hypothetical protein GCM10027085_14560 [Spirosoma aerophilum]